MADATTSSIHIDAPPDQVMEVIADFASYPEWTDQITAVEILDEGDGRRARQVRFSMDAGAIKDSYTLDYDWAADDRSVTWSLVKGGIQKAQDGAYRLEPDGSGTTVIYELSVEVNFPMIGMLRRKAEKVIIDAALKGLKRRVENA